MCVFYFLFYFVISIGAAYTLYIGGANNVCRQLPCIITFNLVYKIQFHRVVSGCEKMKRKKNVFTTSIADVLASLSFFLFFGFTFIICSTRTV